MKKHLLFTFIIMALSLLSNAQTQTELWGMTEKGGEGVGTIFKTDGNGNNLQTIYNFPVPTGGKTPKGGQFCEADNGKLYGVFEGGAYDNGVLVELDPATNVLVKKIDFNKPVNGSSPIGLVKGDNGKLYGITKNGVDADHDYFGTLFEYTVSTNALVTKIFFQLPDFGFPNADMVFANGKIYGTTLGGGAGHCGTIFEYTIATNLLEEKFAFTMNLNGCSPTGKIILNNGIIYGTTQFGGAMNDGALYEYHIAKDSIAIKVSFGGTKGTGPNGGLEAGNDGMFYGASSDDATNHTGSIFKYDPVTGIYTNLFQLNATTQGAGIISSLKKVGDVWIYGMCKGGGTTNDGTLFKFNTSTLTFTKLMDFFNVPKGKSPLGSLMQAANGKLYATTSIGGTLDKGTVFQYDITSSTYTKITEFNEGLNGAYPKGTLMKASNGMLYGTTSEGGTNQKGVLFECNPVTGQVVKKVDFDGTNGANPVFAPVEVNGKLYGTTRAGGTNSVGVLYEYDLKTNVFTKKTDFAYVINGANPAGLMIAANKKIYGVCNTGGKYYAGTLFEYEPGATVIKARGFYINSNNLTSMNGKSPYCLLIEGAAGKLYGIADYTANKKALFEYDIATDTIIRKITYSGGIFGLSSGTLVPAANGKFIGLHSDGTGSAHLGGIFEYDPVTDIYGIKYSFTDRITEGERPIGDLTLATNGKFYGMNAFGGVNEKGVLYEYDYVANTFVKKVDFNSGNGALPSYNSLLEICKTIDITAQNHSLEICENKSLTINSGVNSAGCTFKWMKDAVEISGATAKNYSINAATLADMGWYVCKVDNGCRTIYTDSVYVKVVPGNVSPCGLPPSITLNPTNFTDCENKNATFTVAAINAVSYQWEMSSNGGSSYVPVSETLPYSGSTTTTLTITGASLSMNNYLYRCTATGLSAPNATSNAAKLILNALPVITVIQPSQLNCSGNITNIAYSSAVSGTTYSWIVKSMQGIVTGASAGTGSFIAQALSGDGTVTYEITPSANGCVGAPAPASVKVEPGAAISKQPEEAVVCKGDDVSYSVIATNVASYQWQVNRGNGFVNVPQVSPYSNTKTAALTITSTRDSLNGFQFRVIIIGTCGNTLSSNSAYLYTVIDATAPVFSKCPTDTMIKAGVFNYTLPTATDNCTKNVSVVRVVGLGSGANFPVGTTTETYVATDEAGNKTACSFKVIATIATSIGTTGMDKQFSVYPNPAHQLINVSAKTLAAGGYTLTIRDITGKIILQNIFSTAQTSLDIKDIARGIYFITFQTEKSTQVEKIIVD